ncbi:MAG: hypothetical protein FIB04_04285 [Gammaproteobacteria bacterium]|nr:hypothetical protein [Gammaproteobacteria bacterium]
MDSDIVALFIPIVAIVMSLMIPIVYTIVDYRRRRDIVEANHRERLAAIERGMEIPPLPESFYQPIERKRRPGSALLPGLIWLFIGIGLYMGLAAVAGRDVANFALIPAGVGAAFLIYYFVEGRKAAAAEAPAGAGGPDSGSGA